MIQVIKTVMMIVLLAVASTAWATPITYNFTTTARLPGPSILPGLTGPVTGSFDYDNAVASSGTVPAGSSIPGAAIYPLGVTALNGSVNGNNFSDANGAVFVGDDKFNQPPHIPPRDFFLLSFQTANSPLQDLIGFTLGGLTLSNVRLFWIEGQDGIGDFLPDQNLPNMLPPTTGGRLALDFQDANGVGAGFAMYSVVVTKANVDEPAILLLFTMGLGMMGFVSRQRKQA